MGSSKLAGSGNRSLLSRPAVVGIVLCGVALGSVALRGALAAPAGKAAAGKHGAARFASPEATFETAQQLLTQGKYAELANCFSDDGLKELATYVHRSARSMAEITGGQPGKPATGEFSRKMAAALARFAPAELPKPALEGEGREWQSAANRTIGEAIHDRPAFVAAVFKIWAQSSATGPELKRNLSGLSLHVESDAAPVTIGQMSAGWLDAAPLTLALRQTDGGWKIDSVVEPPPKKLVVAEGETWKARDERMVVDDDPAAAGGGGGSPGGFGGFGGALPSGKDIKYIKPDYHGPRNDLVYFTANLVSSEYAAQSGGAIERSFITIFSPTASAVPERINKLTDRIELSLVPGLYSLVFTAVGTHGATFEPKILHYDLTAGPPKVELDQVDMVPSKFTRLIGQPLPEFPSGARWRGTDPFSLSQLRGHYVVISICSHAGHYPHDSLMRLARMFAQRNVGVMAVHNPRVQELNEKSTATLLPPTHIGDTTPVMIDVEGENSFVARTGANGNCMLLVDPQGKLVARLPEADAQTVTGPALERELALVKPWVADANEKPAISPRRAAR